MDLAWGHGREVNVAKRLLPEDGEQAPGGLVADGGHLLEANFKNMEVANLKKEEAEAANSKVVEVA